MSWQGGVAELLPLSAGGPILAAALLLATGRLLPRGLRDGYAMAVAALVAAADATVLHAARTDHVVTWAGHWLPRPRLDVGIVLVADPFGAGLALLAAVLVLLALLYSAHYFDDVESHYQVLILLFLAGMNGFALTGDLFDLFVFFELMGAAAYALTGLKVEDPTAVQGGLNFAVINTMGAYLSLMGVALLYARTGALGLPQLSRALSSGPADTLVVGAFVLICIGFLVKSAAVPFHFWTADAEAVAPTPVCALLSGAMVALGVYGVARVYFVVFAGRIPHADIERTFVVIGTATALTGAVMCFGQRHLKRLLAYSTIAHVGLFLLAFSTLSDDGLAGGALYVVGHAGVKSALFLLVGVVLNRYGSVDELELHGRGVRARVLPWLFLLGGLALAALPPFATGLGKSLAEDATIARGYVWLPGVFVLTSALTGGAVVRAALRIYFGLGPKTYGGDGQGSTGHHQEVEVEEDLPRVPLTMLVPIVVLLGSALAVGLLPGVAHAFAAGAHRFTDRAGYVAQALSPRAPAGSVPASPQARWTGLGVGLDVLSAALAVGFALLALYRDALPAAVHRLAGAFAPPLHLLRRLHSGRVGDYVAWLFLGTGALGALVGLPLR